MKENNLTSKQVVIVVAIFVIVIFVIPTIIMSLGLNSNNDEMENTSLTSNKLQTIDNSKFEILESSSSYSNDGTYTISGKIKQKEDKNFDGIFVSFIMYDENNQRVRETSMNTSNYLGDGIWQFEAYGNDADKIVTSYKLDHIYGY